jgi:RNA polymerase sigma-70 factor (ECF subfamily)
MDCLPSVLLTAVTIFRSTVFISHRGTQRRNMAIGTCFGWAITNTNPPMDNPSLCRERLAVPFEEIAPIVGRSPAAARQLASRARRHVQERKATPDVDVEVQQSVVAAFVAAARDGDFQRLVAVLDPEVVLRGDAGAQRGRSIEIRGAEQVARGALRFSLLGLIRLPVLVNGAAGLVCTLEGKPFSVMAFTVRGGKIAEIDILRDPERLSEFDLTVLDG